MHDPGADEFSICTLWPFKGDHPLDILGFLFEVSRVKTNGIWQEQIEDVNVNDINDIRKEP